MGRSYTEVLERAIGPDGPCSRVYADVNLSQAFYLRGQIRELFRASFPPPPNARNKSPQVSSLQIRRKEGEDSDGEALIFFARKRTREMKDTRAVCCAWVDGFRREQGTGGTYYGLYLELQEKGTCRREDASMLYFSDQARHFVYSGCMTLKADICNGFIYCRTLFYDSYGCI